MKFVQWRFFIGLFHLIPTSLDRILTVLEGRLKKGIFRRQKVYGENLTPTLIYQWFQIDSFLREILKNYRECIFHFGKKHLAHSEGLVN